MMTHFRNCLCIVMLLTTINVTDAVAEIRVVGLTCEQLINPLGIDVTRPRLSWQLDSTVRGQRQIAFQVLVADTESGLQDGVGNLWNSGRVDSDQSIHVVYSGQTLHARARCYWKVRVWDRDGKPSNWSEPAAWSMGLLNPADWGNSEWIGLEPPSTADRSDDDASLPRKSDESDAGESSSQESGNRTRLPARYLRREFSAKEQVVRATAYVCGLGFFDLFLNGDKIGDHVMDPALSGYKKRAFYVTFDVTDSVKSGDNAVGVVLGNGRYFCPRKIAIGNVPIFGHPKLRILMRIEYGDGTVSDIVSDESWKVTANGPIRANNEYDG